MEKLKTALIIIVLVIITTSLISKVRKGKIKADTIETSHYPPPSNN